MQANSNPPTGIIDAIWPVIGPALTPQLVWPVIVTLAATHLSKILAEAWVPRVTQSAKTWRAFCASASVVLGAIAGSAAWLATSASWPVVPIVAFCSGPAWVLVKMLIPQRFSHVRDAFLTATDRRYRRKEPS